MKASKISLSIVFIFLLAQGFAQQWSEPGLIYKNSAAIGEMDFVVDSDGIFHCVWTEEVDYDNFWIYYSTSNNEGLTWSEPIDISGGTDKLLASLDLVAGERKQLFVSYTYNTANSAKTQILVTRYNGEIWGKADTVSIDTYGGQWSHLAVDNEGKVYCFWYQWGSHGKGVIHLSKYVDGSWGEIEYPYGTDVMMRINDIEVDHSGKFHFAAAREFLNGKYTEMRLAYFTMENDVWSDVEIVNNRHLCLGNDLSVNSSGEPAMIWVELLSGSKLWSCWSEKKSGGWFDQAFLGLNKRTQVAAYDQADVLHMFECQTGSYTDTSRIHHYFIKEGELQEDDIFKEYIPGVRNLKTACLNNKLYLAFSAHDNNASNIDDCRLLLMHTDITVLQEEISVNEQTFSAYPNPFNDYCYIRISSITVEDAIIIIYDGNGRTIRQIKLPKNGQSIKWDGRNTQGQIVPKGIYYILLYSEKSGLRSHIYKTIKM